MSQLHTVIFILLLPFIYSYEEAQGKLQHAIVIMRHGERTPLVEQPNDPHAVESAWPVGTAQLLNVGKMSLFKLGEYFRGRYKDFLPEKYSEKDIYVRSTDVDRTLMSAYAFLAGLYPPQNEQIWNENLRWQPIPVHTTPKELDSLLSMDKNCPHRNQLMKDLYKTNEFQQMQKETKELFEYLTEKSGLQIKNLKDLGDVYFTWVIEETLLNYTSPDWSKAYYNQTYHWFLLHFREQTYTTELARLKTGLLFNEIIELFTNLTKRKLTLYSAHDITIANMLNSLQLFEPHIPTYGSALIFELRADSTDHYVTIYYRNTSDAPIPMRMRNCSFNCPLKEFARLLDPIRINEVEWEIECEEKIFGLLPRGMNHDVIVACSTILVILIILAVFFISFACRRQRKGVNLPKMFYEK